MRTAERYNTMSKIELYLFPVLMFFFVCCSKKLEYDIHYSFLKTGSDVKKTGILIQKLPLGLNKIIYDLASLDTLFVAVHGYGSEGYEWVYPLKLMAESMKQTYYYRWDWNECPKRASGDLIIALKNLLKENLEIKHIILFGHSYGGVITANLMDDQIGSIAIHSIAAPLSGHPKFKKECPDFPDFKVLKLRNPLTQWRTQHKMDGAFKNLTINPQKISIAGSVVIQLPDSSKGTRLGHNWSISWVINEYFNN